MTANPSDDGRLAAVLREFATLAEFAGVAAPSASMRGATGNTPLHVASLRGDRNAVGLLLEAGADPNAVGEGGCTPLHKALERQHLQVARMLLAGGGQLDTVNQAGISPRDLAHGLPLWEGES